MKIKKINKSKKVILVEAAFVFGIFIYLFFSSAPTAYAVAGESILEPDFVFEIEKGEEVWISVNKGFTNPIILEQDSEIQLPPGTYYYKTKNWLRESEVNMFKIDSLVGLNLYERPEGYELENSGNVDLDVSGERSGITGSLGVDDSIDVREDDTYEGKQS